MTTREISSDKLIPFSFPNPSNSYQTLKLGGRYKSKNGNGNVHCIETIDPNTHLHRYMNRKHTKRQIGFTIARRRKSNCYFVKWAFDELNIVCIQSQTHTQLVIDVMQATREFTHRPCLCVCVLCGTIASFYALMTHGKTLTIRTEELQAKQDIKVPLDPSDWLKRVLLAYYTCVSLSSAVWCIERRAFSTWAWRRQAQMVKRLRSLITVRRGCIAGGDYWQADRKVSFIIVRGTKFKC